MTQTVEAVKMAVYSVVMLEQCFTFYITSVFSLCFSFFFLNPNIRHHKALFNFLLHPDNIKILTV